jgi:hypothetical protein
MNPDVIIDELVSVVSSKHLLYERKGLDHKYNFIFIILMIIILSQQKIFKIFTAYQHL